MALTRARVVAGEDSLREEARALIDEVLAKPRNEARLLEDLTEMRGLIEQEKPPRDIWDVKLIPGGLIDIEFIAQYLSLKARAGGWLPAQEDDEAAGLLAGPEAAPAPPKPTHSECTSTDATLKILGPGELGEEVTEELRRALALWSGHAQVVRLCTEGEFSPKQAPAGLIDLLTRTGQAPDPGKPRSRLQDDLEKGPGCFPESDVVGGTGSGSRYRLNHIRFSVASRLMK